MSCSFDLVFFSELVHSVLKPVLISTDHSLSQLMSWAQKKSCVLKVGFVCASQATLIEMNVNVNTYPSPVL